MKLGTYILFISHTNTLLVLITSQHFILYHFHSHEHSLYNHQAYNHFIPTGPQNSTIRKNKNYNSL